VTDPDFLPWLDRHTSRREPLSLENLVAESGGGEHCAVAVVDLLEGFCRTGPLASERILGIVDPIVELLKQTHRLGVSRYLFPCDSHSEDSPEFQVFPPHCVEGTEEAELVREIKDLEFSSLFQKIEKRSISSLVGTELPQILQDEGVRTIICTGDCTDLCLYHLAVGLRYWANAHHLPWKIVVPQNLVATYDLPTAKATELGVLPHPADLLDKIFFYHLELNGVRVVSELV
jgi:nicotinamidase-related amidase